MKIKISNSPLSFLPITSDPLKHLSIHEQWTHVSLPPISASENNSRLPHSSNNLPIQLTLSTRLIKMHQSYALTHYVSLNPFIAERYSRKPYRWSYVDFNQRHPTLHRDLQLQLEDSTLQRNPMDDNVFKSINKSQKFSLIWSNKGSFVNYLSTRLKQR